MYEILKFGHVLCMFTAATIFVGGEFYGFGIERSRDVPGIRRYYTVEKRLEPVAIGIVILGGILGLITALNGHLDLTQTWLVMGYGFFLALMLTGIIFWGPRSTAILEAAQASPDDAPSAELEAVLTRRHDPIVIVFDGFLWVGVLFTMVTKPFS